jgi:NitT/TauT family transport system substrate-binding protein
MEARWSRRGLLAAAAVAAAGGVAALRAAAPAASAGGPVALTAAYGGVNPAAVPLWLADRLGYFRAAGLRVTLQDAPWNTEPLRGLDAGAFRFVTISMDLLEWDLSCCSARGRRADAVYVAAAVAVPVFDVLGGPEVRTLADLRGRTVGVAGEPASAAHFALRTALARVGLSLREVRVVEGQPSKTYFQRLKAGTLDAAVLPPPMSIRSVELGYHLLADAGRYGVPYPSAWLATDRGFAARQPEVVRRFVRAYVQGLQAMRQRPSEAVAAIGEVGGVGQPAVARATYEAFARYLLPRAEPPLAGVRNALAFLAENYPSEAPLLRRADPRRFVDASFLPA